MSAKNRKDIHAARHLTVHSCGAGGIDRWEGKITGTTKTSYMCAKRYRQKVARCLRKVGIF